MAELDLGAGGLCPPEMGKCCVVGELSVATELLEEPDPDRTEDNLNALFEGENWTGTRGVGRFQSVRYSSKIN